MKRRKIVLGIGVLLAASLFLAACGGGDSNSLDVTLKGEDISYDITSITAEPDQMVNLTLDNVGALEHSIVIEELGVNTGFIPAGESTTVSFTLAEAATYTYFCDVPGHREAGMEGTLTVNQR